MVHISDRWNRDKTHDLQYAFFNGEGWESWENIRGIWNGITPRDAEATRRIASIERGIGPYLNSAGWEPFAPMRRYGVFARRWPLEESAVWTIVNRNEYDPDGPQMNVPAGAGVRFFELYRGTEIEAKNGALSFPIEAHRFGAILMTRGERRLKSARCGQDESRRGAPSFLLLARVEGSSAEPGGDCRNTDGGIGAGRDDTDTGR